ncbi:hypothetical protein ANCCAN_12834 [Ancylostoma caninum]|uniref:Uncharacterized protein n=1 Tax=Ancylostoma caninum TaxID=29170 RepID=A0A368G9X4_ANCCA|nr:hypothetical protein ANCCAN_12834 [Ancylostoma caninum]
MQRRRALSSSPPLEGKKEEDINFEYQSEDSELDSSSTSSQEAEVYEGCSKVEVGNRLKKSKSAFPFKETRVVHTVPEYFIDYLFS